MSDFLIESRALTKYVGTAHKVAVPDSVKTIGEGAFRECPNVTEITLPESCTAIGKNAFRGLARLARVTLPERLLEIGEGAFADCPALTSLTLPHRLERIGAGAFAGSGLTALAIPVSVNKIGDGVMRGCTALATLTVDAMNLHYYAEDGVLYTVNRATVLECSPGRKQATLTLPATVRVIAKQAFYGNSRLAEITLQKGITDIEAQAFAHCRALRTLTLPEGIRAVEAWAFRDCAALSELTLPHGEYSIKDGAFLGCYSLAVVTLPAEMRPAMARTVDRAAPVRYVDLKKPEAAPAWMNASAFGSLYAQMGLATPKTATSAPAPTPTSTPTPKPAPAVPKKRELEVEGDTLVFYGETAGVAIPDTVRKIGKDAFRGCALRELTLPEGVREIEDGALHPLALERLTLPGIFAARIKGILAAGAKTEVTYTIDTTGGFTVEGTDLVAYDGETREVVIPEGVASFNCDVFGDPPVNAMTLPASLSEIEEGALSYLASLDEITVTEGSAHFKSEDGILTSADGDILYRVRAHYHGRLAVNSRRVATAAVFGLSEYTELAIGTAVREIGDYAFMDCEMLERVEIAPDHNGELTIGEGAFDGCPRLTRISCPARLADTLRAACPGVNVTVV